jgi:hypothetical protein
MSEFFSRAPLAALPVLIALLACGDGGKNEHQRGVGDEPGGVKLGIGDIAVAPQGGYMIFSGADQLAVAWPDSGSVAALPVRAPTRLAFAKTRPAVYVGSLDGGSKLVAIDVEARRRLWASAIDDAAVSRLKLQSSPDDRFVVAGSSNQLTVFDSATGSAASKHTFATAIIDIEMLPDSRRALVVTDHTWPAGSSVPKSELVVIDLEAGGEVRFTVPNCADDIAVNKTGTRALLAPTRCSKDPVSVIELTPGSERFSRNLPGFGPVAMAPDGATAVAFLDVLNIEGALFDDPTQIPPNGLDDPRYHLMIIDTDTLGYDLAAVGDSLPRYAMTPSGQILLVDSTLFGKPLRLFDTATRAFRDVDGPSVKLNNFAFSSDSRHAYVLYPELFDIDVPAALVTAIDLPFVPQNLNIAADDRSLYLRRDNSHVCVFDLTTQRCQRELTYEPVVVTTP